jgi:hypothetical protein
MPKCVSLFRCATLHLVVQSTLLQPITATDLRDLLLVAVNLKHPQPARRILQHMQQHQQLLYAGSSVTTDNSTSNSSSSSSSVQLVDHLITTAIARGRWEVAYMLAGTPAAQ